MTVVACEIYITSITASNRANANDHTGINSSVVFITGAGGAVGRSTALWFDYHGVTQIAGLDINADALAGTGSALKEAHRNVEFLPITADLTSEDAVTSAINTTAPKFRAIHYTV